MLELGIDGLGNLQTCIVFLIANAVTWFKIQKYQGFPGTHLPTSTAGPWVPLVSQHILTDLPGTLINHKFAYLSRFTWMVASSTLSASCWFSRTCPGRFSIRHIQNVILFYGHSGFSQFFSAVFLICHLPRRFPAFFTSGHTHWGEWPQRAPAHPTPNYCTLRSKTWRDQYLGTPTSRTCLDIPVMTLS